MTPLGIIISSIFALFWLAMTSCVVQTKTPEVTVAKLSIDDQDKRTGDALREASQLMESGSRKKHLSRLEELYLSVIDTYQESRYVPDCYMTLISLYLTDFDPPAFSKAEALRARYLDRYPAAALKKTIDENLARAYAADAQWEKLRRLYLPAVRRFIEAWHLVEPFDMLMYSEAKLNLGDYEEARKGFNIVIKFFPASNERTVAQERINALQLMAVETVTTGRLKPLSDERMSRSSVLPGAPHPTKEIWKEVVYQNGDRSWIDTGAGIPPPEPTGQGTVSATARNDGKPRPERSMLAVGAPPDVHPPPENLEEKVRMKDNGRFAIAPASGIPHGRSLSQPHIPDHKQREAIASAPQNKTAVVQLAAPHLLERNEGGVSVQGNGQFRLSADLNTLSRPQQDQKELPPMTEDAGLRYSVQVGFFRSEKNALSLADKLKKRGYDAHLRRHMRSGQKVFFRVLVGHFPDEQSAVEHGGLIREKEELKFIIFDKGK